MVMQNEKGKITHGQGEQVKISLLPDTVGKKSVNDLGPTVGSQHHLLCLFDALVVFRPILQ